MDLVEKVRNVARTENIPESELILEEVEAFQQEHKDHGPWELTLMYEQSGMLNSIYLECSGYDLINLGAGCPTNNPDTIPELRRSFIYLRNKTKDLEIQKQRREGKIDYEGNSLTRKISI
jgi:hypothetical protein